MGSLASPLLALVFAAGAVATWIAGITLAKSTDALDNRFNLGDAIGGMVLLSIAGTLPEIAITVSAAAQNHLDLAAGNLIGGIAIQTMVLIICDITAGRKSALTYLVGSLIPVLEALLVILVVSFVLMGALLKQSVAIGPVSPASIAIVVVWFAGIVVINRVRKAPSWEVIAPGSRPGRPHRRVPHPKVATPHTGTSTWRVALYFGAACVVTLVAGVFLQISGSDLAGRAHMNGVIFGATVLAVASALPEISSGIGAVRLGDHGLAMGDIFGGNAFQVCLFLVADLIAGKAVLPASGNQNGWLAILGIGLTSVYAIGVIFRPKRCYLRLGADSIFVVALFALGIAGLVTIPAH
ncbi:MAG: sodium:calcium antiporter [Gaiellaceae bacterium]|jgi:cation:H+ antiporter